MHDQTPGALGAYECAPSDFFAQPQHDHDIGVIIYTSATTGSAKAVRLSTRNLLRQLHSQRQTFDIARGDVVLSLLPPHTIVALSLGLLTAFACGCRVHYSQSPLPAQLVRTLTQQKITHVITVARCLELFRDTLKARFTARYGANGTDILSDIQSLARSTRCRTLRRHLSGRILNEMGAHLRSIIVCNSSAAAGPADFFNNMGIDVWQGYAQTEAGGFITVNSPARSQHHFSGVALPGNNVWIKAFRGEKIGEILVKGSHVMCGYHGDNVESVIDDEGWLHTGDLGYVSKGGCLRLLGRMESMIKVPPGRYVMAAQIARSLIPSNLFVESCVIGLDSSGAACTELPFNVVCAVVVPNMTIRQSQSPEALQILCENEVHDLVRDLPRYRRPARVFVRLRPLPKTDAGHIRTGELRKEVEHQLGYRPIPLLDASFPALVPCPDGA